MAKDPADFLIEGYAQQTTRNSHAHDYSTIESEEIIETNRDYSFYFNYFYNQVIFIVP